MINWLERLIGETQIRLLGLLRRSPQTITVLAEALGLTDNAVRLHIAALHRDGVVDQVGTQRDTGGKPARIYGLTRAGEELFPKAYALVLGKLVEEIVRSEGRDKAIQLLRAVGAQAAASARTATSPRQRLEAAAGVFRDLGADVEVRQTTAGWRLQGYGCPLSAVTSGHPEMCELAKALVEEVVGAAVTECCQRGDHPRCAFELAESA
ncbi:MAG TPA: ArsR family transcriptional regulator [Gemmatimonadales bacterium]|jgi:predicted ArsR family transcriptional regulator|nr:ArsR family transcriptional regulator [Gemmatimonadales bacterium]